MGFVVDRVALGQVFSEYFSFLLPIIPPNTLHLSSGAGTMTDVTSGLSLAEHQHLLKRKKYSRISNPL
jgi:hypothetical protein